MGQEHSETGSKLRYASPWANIAHWLLLTADTSELMDL